VEEAMKAVFDVLNFLAQRLLAEELYDGPPVGSDGGTVPMLQVLRDGLKVKAERAERLRSGNWEITDIRQEPI
jgi:hypothetical protein